MTVPLDRRLEAAPAPLFAPLGLALPLRVEQTEREAFDADPALASFVLRSAQAVLEADAVAAAFDCAGVPSEEALALTRRLVDEMGEGTAVLGTLAAPSTLVRHFSGTVEDAARLTTAAVDGLCGAGAAGLVMLEAAEDPNPALFGDFDAAFNLAAYYQVPVLYLARREAGFGVLDAARAAGARWAVGPGDADGAVASVPLGLFDGDDASAWAAGLPGGVRLFVSSWEVPAGTEVECVAALRRALRG